MCCIVKGNLELLLGILSRDLCDKRAKIVMMLLTKSVRSMESATYSSGRMTLLICSLDQFFFHLLHVHMLVVTMEIIDFLLLLLI